MCWQARYVNVQELSGLMSHDFSLRMCADLPSKDRADFQRTYVIIIDLPN